MGAQVRPAVPAAAAERHVVCNCSKGPAQGAGWSAAAPGAAGGVGAHLSFCASMDPGAAHSLCPHTPWRAAAPKPCPKQELPAPSPRGPPLLLTRPASTNLACMHPMCNLRSNAINRIVLYPAFIDPARCDDIIRISKDSMVKSTVAFKPKEDFDPAQQIRTSSGTLVHLPTMELGTHGAIMSRGCAYTVHWPNALGCRLGLGRMGSPHPRDRLVRAHPSALRPCPTQCTPGQAPT